MEHAQYPLPPLADGVPDFEIEVGAVGEPWTASNGAVAVTCFDSDRNSNPSKRMASGQSALLYKSNSLHGAGSNNAWREQVCIAELNGVFVHVCLRDGVTSIVVADKRLN